MDIGVSYEIALIVLCIILSSFFSAAETTLTSLGEMKTRHIIKEKGAKALSLELWLKSPNKVLNTILFGNNLVNIFSAVLAGNITARYSDNIFLTTGVMTLIVLIFGEIIPKTFARYNSESIAISVMNFLRLFYYVFFPISWSMNKLTSGFLILIGGKSSNKGPSLTKNELEFIIDMSGDQGVLERNNADMIAGIFDISELYVREIMVPRIDMVAVSKDITKDELMKVICDSEFSRIPVYDENRDNVIGVLFTKDMIKHMSGDWKVEDVMQTMRTPFFVPENKKIDDMLKVFQKNRLHMAIVIDEYDGVAGIVTMEDILEEIVGEIWDEYDDAHLAVEIISEKEAILDTRMKISDFCEYFSLERTEDMSEFETVGGLVYQLAGEIPSVGDSYKWQGYTITVKEMNKRKLEKILFAKTDE